MIYLLLELFVSVVLIALVLYSVFTGLAALVVLGAIAESNLPSQPFDRFMIMATVCVCLMLCRVLWVGYRRARAIEKGYASAK